MWGYDRSGRGVSEDDGKGNSCARDFRHRVGKLCVATMKVVGKRSDQTFPVIDGEHGVAENPYHMPFCRLVCAKD